MSTGLLHLENGKPFRSFTAPVTSESEPSHLSLLGSLSLAPKKMPAIIVAPASNNCGIHHPSLASSLGGIPALLGTRSFARALPSDLYFTPSDVS